MRHRLGSQLLRAAPRCSEGLDLYTTPVIVRVRQVERDGVSAIMKKAHRDGAVFSTVHFHMDVDV